MISAERFPLALLESLGDNAELDTLLERRGHGRPSPFRHAIVPLETLNLLLESPTARDALRLEDLEPIAPTVARDTATGIRFGTELRSVEIDGERRFEADERTRVEINAREKARFEAEFDALLERVSAPEPRLFVVKCNAGADETALAALESWLARHAGGEHLLVSVATGDRAPEWRSATRLAMEIARLAPRGRVGEIDESAWDELLERLWDESRVRALARVPRLEGWDETRPEEERRERFENELGELRDIGGLQRLFDELGARDPRLHRRLGGEILHRLRAGETAAVDESDLDADFDNRYLALLALHSRIDLDGAETLHRSAESLYRRHGRSLVRYARIGDAIVNSRRVLRNFADDGKSLVRVRLPRSRSLPRVTLEEGRCVERALEAAAEGSSLLTLELGRPRPRGFRRLSTLDDAEEADRLWIEASEVRDVERVDYRVLTDARLTCRPSTLVCRDGDRWQVADGMRDIYHHGDVAARVGLGRERERLDRAWFLPRFGPVGNHYHSLVDKLPSLYGYRLLGLDCPLVAAEKPNAVLRHFMRRLDIDPDAVRVDEGAEIVATRGLVAAPQRLRAPFADFCASLPSRPSPTGPRIYIARGDASGRGMVNEPDVERRLRARGFDIVRMEEHELPVQIAIAANASTIVAPHGAGLANMLFARRGCRIVELIPERYMVRFFWQLAVDCLHRYAVLVGRMEEGVGTGETGKTLRWRSDPDALERLLDDVDAQDADDVEPRRSA